MNADLSTLADDALISKQDVVVLETKYQEKNHYLEERIHHLQNELFGRKSEIRYPEPDRQLPIFNSDCAEKSISDKDLDDSIFLAAHSRKKRGRKPLPDHLPRVEIIHDLSEEQKVCHCGATVSYKPNNLLLSRINLNTCAPIAPPNVFKIKSNKDESRDGIRT